MQPNILFIMTDQQRRNSLGAYGCHYSHTPNLDALASEATVYDHCYCDAPVCTPSRACTLTGKTMPGHGVYNLFDILPRDEKLLPFYLKEQGYDTALVGKLHVSGIEFEAWQRNPGDGFDLYELCHEPSLYLDSPFNGYARWLEARFPEEYAAVKAQVRTRRYRAAESHFSTWVSQRSAQIIKERDKTKPLFLMAGYFDPHNPYDHHPPEWADRLHEEAREPVVEDLPGTEFPEGLRWERDYRRPKSLQGEGAAKALEHMRRGYYASVSFIDDQVEAILKALKDEGIYDDTLIIYTSDHGDMLGDHGLFTKGAIFYEDGVNVPLIVKYPGQKEGRRSDRLVNLRDLFSTMYTAAGGDDSLRQDSLPLQGKAEREFAITEYRGCGKYDMNDFPHPLRATMIRSQEWKLNLYHDSREMQLFHMEEDPEELHDLSSTHEGRMAALTLLEAYLSYDAQRDYNLNAGRGGLSAVPSFANLPSQKAEGSNANPPAQGGQAGIEPEGF